VFVRLPFSFTSPLGRGTTPDLSRIWESYHRVYLFSNRVEGGVVVIVLRGVGKGEGWLGYERYRIVMMIVEQEGYKEQEYVCTGVGRV
jgi:hypothetical protein